MRILIPNLLLVLGLALTCVTSRAQLITCGDLVTTSSGGNVCGACSGNQQEWFIENSQGKTMGMYGCTKGSLCGEWQAKSSTLGCVAHNATKQTIQDKFLAMAMPRKLLINSCKGGLYPFELDPAWFGKDQPTKVLPKREEGE